MLAKVFGSFRLVRDPELRQVNEKSSIVNMTLVSSEKYKDNETSCFISAKAWNKPFIAEYFQKGDQIIVSGKLSEEHWEKDGDKKSKHVLIVEDIDFGQKAKKSSSSESFKSEEDDVQDFNSDSIPF